LVLSRIDANGMGSSCRIAILRRSLFFSWILTSKVVPTGCAGSRLLLLSTLSVRSKMGTRRSSCANSGSSIVSCLSWCCPTSQASRSLSIFAPGIETRGRGGHFDQTRLCDVAPAGYIERCASLSHQISHVGRSIGSDDSEGHGYRGAERKANPTIRRKLRGHQ